MFFNYPVIYNQRLLLLEQHNRAIPPPPPPPTDFILFDNGDEWITEGPEALKLLQG